MLFKIGMNQRNICCSGPKCDMCDFFEMCGSLAGVSVWQGWPCCALDEGAMGEGCVNFAAATVVVSLR